MNFTPVDNQGRVDGFCLVKTVEQKTSSKGDFYLDFTLSDADGEINAKLWRYSEVEYGTFKSGDIVKVRGTVSQYNGTDQLRIERIRPAIEQDNVKVEDFVRSAAYSSEQMYNEIINISSPSIWTFKAIYIKCKPTTTLITIHCTIFRIPPKCDTCAICQQ